ncbi:MAG: carboxypeptidase-like regulatory domain-containing protein [Bacteroidota bacterium]
MKHIKICIPKPCAQEWNEMASSSHGRHCLTCQKEVKDFSAFSTEAIQDYFRAHRDDHTCGRFSKIQLIDLAKVQPSITSKAFLSTRIFVLSLLTIPLTFKVAKGQNQIQIPVETTPTIKDKNFGTETSVGLKTIDSTRIVRGSIFDRIEPTAPMVGATVMIKGTALKTNADANGNFQLDLTGLDLPVNPILFVAYIGYENFEVELNMKHNRPLKIKLVESVNGEVCVGVPGFFRRITRWFH